MIDLNKAPLAALVAEYNRLTGENVKRFADRKSAVKRLVKAQAEVAPKVLKPRTSNFGLNDKKIVVKKAEIEVREGTKRVELLRALLASKTVLEARTRVSGIDWGMLDFAIKAGYIELR